MIDLAPPPLWVPPKPAIIRPYAELRREARGKRAILPGLAPVVIASLQPTVTYIDNASSDDNASSYNLGNFDIGSSGGLVVVCVTAVGSSGLGGNRTISSVSIGGSNGTIHVQRSSSLAPTGVASRLVGGGNVNVTVNMSGTVDSCFAAVWVLRNLQSTTPVGSAENDQTGTTSVSVSMVTIPAFGVAVLQSGGGTSINWSTAEKAFDGGGGSQLRSGAYLKAGPNGISSHSETASGSGSNNRTMVYGAWR